jgi:hypothetical protein
MTKMTRLAAVLAVLSFSGLASAAPHGILRARGASAFVADPKSGDLAYYGGPVISNARVYAVYWGDNVAAETKRGIPAFLENMLDSTYMDWLNEYNTSRQAVDGRMGTNQTIGRGTYAGAYTIQPQHTSTQLMDEEIRQELEAQIKAGKLPPNDGNTLYMTYFPAGVGIEIAGMRSCQTFCAYHEGFKTAAGSPVFYGIMPVCGGYGCGFGDAFGNLTVVSSHEAIEAITDPFPTPGNSPAYPQAWNTTNGEEIGDLCASSASTLTGHGVTSRVQGQYRNSTHSCYNGPWRSQRLETADLSAVTPARASNEMPTLAALKAGAACFE